MITEEEYLKAKVIVDRYEQELWEYNMRKAEEELEFDEDHDPNCHVCGRNIHEEGHLKNCPEDDSPYATLCRVGYD